MILWHLGGTLLIVRYVFRDPGMDLRWVLAGALLPDIIDKPIASILFHDYFGTHRVYGHTLLFPVVLMVAVLVITRRGSAARSASLGVVIAVFVHLVLDGVWTSPEGFLWPLSGFDFPKVSGSGFGELVAGMLSSPAVWAGEALGAAYLVYLWRRYLQKEGSVREFMRTGAIPLRPTHS